VVTGICESAFCSTWGYRGKKMYTLHTVLQQGAKQKEIFSDGKKTRSVCLSVTSCEWSLVYYVSHKQKGHLRTNRNERKTTSCNRRSMITPRVGHSLVFRPDRHRFVQSAGVATSLSLQSNRAVKCITVPRHILSPVIKLLAPETDHRLASPTVVTGSLVLPATRATNYKMLLIANPLVRLG